jgi:CRISPR-associated protein Cmr4
VPFTLKTYSQIRDHVAVLHDDDFTHFVRHATEVVARVGLDYEKKTVRQGIAQLLAGSWTP